MALEPGGDIGARRVDGEAQLTGIGHQRLDQPRRHAAPADGLRHQGVIGLANGSPCLPGETADRGLPCDMGVVFPGLAAAVAGDRDLLHRVLLLDAARAPHHCSRAKQFLSDNAAAVHPRVWEALRAADAPQPPYDNDALSQRLDEVFADLFGRPCAVLWVATGTAANCLALSTLVPPHGGVVCHREAHIETDEGGAPGFYTHGAKLILAEGEGAKLTPQGIDAVIAGIRKDVHQVQPQAISVTQASEYGRCYRPEEMAAVAAAAEAHGLALHVDGARFANAVAWLGCTPWHACVGAKALSFGCVKNGGMSAEALVFFDEGLAEVARLRRKRAGHLQSKGRFLAAQILAMVEDGLWLENARAANAAAQELAVSAGQRLLHPVEANELFLRLTAAEREALRSQGFSFYDWGDDAARLVTAWNSPAEHVAALARAIAAL